MGFSLGLIGTDASAQNGRCENHNHVYGQMMRYMLHSADIGPAYWSFALIYAVYIKPSPSLENYNDTISSFYWSQAKS